MRTVLFLVVAWVALSVMLRMADHWFTRAVVETAQIVVGLCLFVVLGTMAIVKIIVWSDTESNCRRAWTDIAEYPVLVEVCRNSEARAALALSVFADDVARGLERLP